MYCKNHKIHLNIDKINFSIRHYRGCSPIRCFWWQVIFQRWVFQRQRRYRSITVPATSKSSGDSIPTRQWTFTMVSGLIHGGVKCNRRFPPPSPRSAENSPLPWLFSPLVFPGWCRPMFGQYQGRRKSAIAFAATVENFKPEILVEVCRLAWRLGCCRNCSWATPSLSAENSSPENYLSLKTCNWRTTKQYYIEINFINI